MKVIDNVLSGIKALGTPELLILLLLAALFAAYGKSIRRVGTKGMVFVGVLCALAGALGAAMRTIPGIQPTSFLVIMAGVLLGPGAGLAAGALSALLFDILSVITIYTPWRMLLWGLMGLGGAYIKPKPWFLSPYGFVWGFMFGWVLNSVFILAGILPLTWKVFFVSCVSSFWFDFSHAACNAVLLAAFPGFIVKLARKSGLYIGKKA